MTLKDGEIVKEKAKEKVREKSRNPIDFSDNAADDRDKGFKNNYDNKNNNIITRDIKSKATSISNNSNVSSRGTYQAIQNNVNDDSNNITNNNKNCGSTYNNNKNETEKGNKNENKILLSSRILLEEPSFREEKALVSGNFNTYSTGAATKSYELDHDTNIYSSGTNVINSNLTSRSQNQNSHSDMGNVESGENGGKGKGRGKEQAVINETNLNRTDLNAAQMKNSNINMSNSNVNQNSNLNKGLEQKVRCKPFLFMRHLYL